MEDGLDRGGEPLRTLSGLWASFCDGVAADGSTRALGLVRLGLPLIVWTEWGEDLLVLRDLRPPVIAIGLSTFFSTALLFVGYRSRLAALWSALSIYGVIAYLGITLGRPYVHHHTHMLLLTAFLLALTPCGGSYSVDRWLAVRRARRAGAPVPPEVGPLWGQRLLCVHLSTIYLWTAWQKLSVTFLSGARLQHLYIQYYGGSELPPWPLSTAMIPAAWITVALELFLAIGLWFARTRRVAIVAGVLFHLVLYLALPVATFSVQVILLYLLFLDPRTLHAFLDDLQAPSVPANPAR